MNTIWTQLKRRYKVFEHQRRQAISLSTEIRIEAKKMIHKVLHSGCSSAHQDICSLKKKVNLLLRLVRKNPYLYNVGAMYDGLEEYAELIFVEMYMCDDKSALRYLPKEMHHEPLIGGIADASGELVRLARSQMNVEEAVRAHKFMADLYHKFLDLEVARNNKLRSKMEDIQRNMIRIEEIIFNLKLKQGV